MKLIKSALGPHAFSVFKYFEEYPIDLIKEKLHTFFKTITT